MHSKIDPNKRLATLFYFDALVARQDLLEPDSILQVAVIPFQRGSTVAPHRHLGIQRSISGTQEVWVVARGTITVQMFDLDDSPIDCFRLVERDVFVTLSGGHAILEVEEDSILYEIKNGPYLGESNDRVHF